MDYYTCANNILTKEPEFIRLPNGQTITSPTARQYATLRNAYPLSNEPAPTPPEGKIAVKTGYKQIGGYWVAQYEYQDAPPTPPKTYDKYRLVDALMKENVWEYIEAWLKEEPNAWTRAIMAPDISGDEPLLAEGIATIKQMLGWDDEKVAEVLAQAEL